MRSQTGVHMKKINKPLLIALIIGAAYLVYSLVYWSGANAGSGSSSEQLGAAVATAMVIPHLVLVALAVVFNALATFLKKSAFALTAGILYAVAMVLFIPLLASG
jgi:magnesium-transporting ATPase (P-type)